MAGYCFLLLLFLSISAVSSSDITNLRSTISDLGLQPTSNPCLHPGISCQPRGSTLRATRIRFPSRGLTGFVPASISRLPELRELSLPDNRLSGPLPSEISYCSKLERLDLRNNRLSGEVPLEISSLVRLRSLDLSSNLFSGDLSFLIQFPNLENLSLANNSFSGRIPLSLSSFRNLVFLDLSGNPDLHGILPRLGNSLRQRSLLPTRSRLLAENKTTKSNSSTRTRNSIKGAAPAPSPLPSHSPHDKKHKHRVRNWVAGFIAGAVAGLISGFIISVVFRMIRNFFCGRYKETTGPSIFSPIIKNSADLSFLEKDDILSSLEIIGQGGCGEVYKAELPNNPGKIIAIKRIKKISERHPTEEESRLLDKWERQIRSEILTVGRIRHRNLLPLVAHMVRPDSHFLIYEYMKNGSLHDAIKRVSEGSLGLDWPARLNIAKGIAAGLEYLHIHHKTHIIHRDLKPANILLDDDMEARIADFGLAKEIPDTNTHMTTSNVAGTAGYIAPEYNQMLRFTVKCDIYSFGVILAVLVTGKFPSDDFFQETDEMSLVKWLRNVMSSANPSTWIDPKLVGNGFEVQMLLVLRIACFCTADDPKDRPNSKDVRLMLSQIDR